MYAGEISSEEIRKLPLARFNGRIFYIDTQEEFDRIWPLLASVKVLGFDTESKPSFKKGIKNKIALLQLADATNAFIFRVSKLGIPPELVCLLEDKKICKIGVAVHDDLRFLSSLHKLLPAGFVDLQKFSTEFRIESNGLRKLAGIVLNVKISKSQQLSDWERAELTEAQKVYAATDAWICYEIYNKLKNSRLK